MKKVRILKDGEYKGVEYKVGEIWDFVREHAKNKTVVIIKDNKKTIVSIVNNNNYGKEAEIIEETAQEETIQIELIL